MTTGTVHRFEDLIAWQKGRALVRSVYRKCSIGRFRDDRALLTQIRKSAVSIPSNVAEGFERGGRREFHQFVSIAKGSCAELRTQIYIACDAGFLSDEEAQQLLSDAEEVGRILGGLRKSLKPIRLSPQSSVLITPRRQTA
jgi:four helix bundle protein